MLWRFMTVVALAALAAPSAHAVFLSAPLAMSKVDAINTSSSYAEVGDAGDRFAPQDVIGTGISQITGTIGDLDGVDAFRFYFAGGSIQFTGTAVTDGVMFPLALTLFAAPPSGPPGVPIPYPNLLAGNYILEATLNTIDPPFTINIIDPVSGGPQTVSAPVPEPGTLILLAFGVASLSVMRRKTVAA